MNTNSVVSCTQPIIILDDSVQKVGVFTNSKTTSQICVLSNRIISGLDDEKKSYGLQHNLQLRWEAAIKPVSNPLRCFDEHDNACFVPTTDGPCHIDFEPGIRLGRGDASQVDSKVYRNPKYDSRCGNSPIGSNQGNTDRLAQIESSTTQIRNDYEEALQILLTSVTNTSAPTDQYVPIPWSVPPASAASWTLKGDVKTQFAIYSEERRCKLAIECRVTQLTIDKGVKVSRDGTVYSEFLAQVRSQPKVWQAVKHIQKELPAARCAFAALRRHRAVATFSSVTELCSRA